jgi:hypothetical protein
MTTQTAAPAATAAPRKAIPLDEALGSKMEDDRLALQPGIEPFYITDVFFDSQTRYNKDPVTGEGKMAKINGVRNVDKIDINNAVKYRTTAGPLLTQLEKITAKNASGNGHYRLPVGPVTVINQLSETPGKNGEQVFYYKLVPAPTA